MVDEATGTETATETTEAAATDAGAAVETTATETAEMTEAGDGTVLGGEGEAAVEAVDVPDAYELKLADDQPVDAEVLDMATPVLKELKLSQESAQKLMPFANEIATRSAAAAIANHQIEQAQAFTSQKREWVENAKGDAEIGGAKWDETTTLAAKGLDLLGFAKGSEFRKFLNESGFGDHPEMIRAFRRIGERVSEDSFARGEGGGGGKVDRLSALYPNDVPNKEGA